MRIQYKQPYWIKFEWDIQEYPDDQYVTNFNKLVNNEFISFLYGKQFAITSTFKIEKSFVKDKISMIYGKPGKAMGLSYNSMTQCLAFEFWLTVNGVDEFRYFHMKGVSADDVENGVTITIIRDGDMLIAYKNFVEINRIHLDGKFIQDYKIPELFLGCASPQSYEKKHRYHCEVEYELFSIITNVSEIEEVRSIHNLKNEKLITQNCYKDILCLYDFKTINNLGIVYDESRNMNFLEMVPDEFVL